MGMGYGAAIADTIEQDFVKEVCSKEFDALLEALDKNPDITLEDFARSIVEEEENDSTKGIHRAYKDLIAEFEKKTGLFLFIGYHDSENDGDRYDEVDGVYWNVENVYQYTPSGEKYKEKITRHFFVQFG